MLGSSWTYSPSGGNHLRASRPTRELVNYWKAVAPESRDPDQWRKESSVSQQRPALWCSFSTWAAKDFPSPGWGSEKSTAFNNPSRSLRTPGCKHGRCWSPLNGTLKDEGNEGTACHGIMDTLGSYGSSPQTKSGQLQLTLEDTMGTVHQVINIMELSLAKSTPGTARNSGSTGPTKFVIF